jgi:hypothetical protein
MIQSAMRVESFQKALIVSSIIKINKTTLTSTPLHIAVGHKSVHFVYICPSEWSQIEYNEYLSNSDRSDISRIDLLTPASDGTIPIPIAVHQLDATLTLLLLAFHANQNNLSEDKKEALLTKVSSNLNEGIDALRKLKMDEISKVLKLDDIPSPEEIYQNYEAKPKFYEERFKTKFRSLSINMIIILLPLM